MAYQFLCPNGHLLEGEPYQAGSQCQCPTCGALFVIPAPPTQATPMAMPAFGQAAPADPGPFAYQVPAQPGPATTLPAAGPFAAMPGPAAPEEAPRETPRAGPRVGPGLQFPDVATPGAGGRVAFDPTGQIAGPKMLHIPCPEGHMLETPPEMLGEEVICPHCGRQFTLREKNSVEYKRKQRAEQEKRDIRAGKNWLTWAVIIVVAVVIGLAVMIAVGTW